MPAYRLKRFSRPDVLRSIHPQNLLQLLNPYRDYLSGRGFTWPTPGTNEKLDYSTLVKILVTPDVDTPKELADALYFIHEMSTHEGMDALLEVVSLETLHCSFLELAPADVAVRVWLHDSQTLERVHAELAATHPKRFEYYQTYANPAPPFVPPTAEQLRPLERALGEVFEKKVRGRGVRVFAYPHDQDCLFLVRHGDPYRREEALDGDEASSVLYRPLRFDVVIYDPRTGTIRIHAKTKWELSLYRGQFGKHLFGGMDFFPNIGRYTLEPLRSGESACLACADVPQIKYVTLTEIHLHWGGEYDEVVVHKARNVFAAIKRRKGSLPTRPKIMRASFFLKLRGEKVPCTVTITPPNIAQYSREDKAPIIDQWLSLRHFIRRRVQEANEETPPLLAGN